MKIDILSLIKQTNMQDLERVLLNIENEVNEQYEKYEDELYKLNEKIELLESNKL